MKIGVTERGDAGLDLSWINKLDTVDGAVLITKNLTSDFINALLDLRREGKIEHIAVHCNCTGLGGTVYEPNVPYYKDQIDAAKWLLEACLEPEQFVLRIDPIIPNQDGIQAFRNVMDYAKIKLRRFWGQFPIRISIYDEYKHVKERFRATGLEPVYPGTNFYASQEQFDALSHMFEDEYPDCVFETCAEPRLHAKNVITNKGCINAELIRSLGLDVPDDIFTNPQNRFGCCCLSLKTELLTKKKQCPHKCIYCYWRDNQ